MTSYSQLLIIQWYSSNSHSINRNFTLSNSFNILSSEFVWQILIFTFWCSFLPQSQHTQVRQNSIYEPTKIWSDENIFVQPSKVELTKLLSVSSFSAFEAFAAESSLQFYAKSASSDRVCVMSSCVMSPDVLLWHWPFPMSPDVSHDNLIPANTRLSSQILVNTQHSAPLLPSIQRDTKHTNLRHWQV